MTHSEFNNKWSDYLEDGHYGLAINHPEVTAYLDREFTEEIKTNHYFSYSQIKLKFGMARVYAKSTNERKWEMEIDKILNEEAML